MLETAFAKRYPLETEGHRTLRERGVAACREYLEKGLGERDAEERLCSPRDEIYWQQLSEVLFARQLTQAGLLPSHRGSGPDFLIEHEQRRIWIEVICPTPAGIPADWFAHEDFKVRALPHETMLLRWTSAIKEKSEKLIGTREGPATGYLAKGIVGVDDVYVVAINGRLLRSRFPQLEGISQLPFAVEATFSVGPYAVTINHETLELTAGGHQYRPLIPKPNGAQVPAGTFLDPRFAPISAIWAMDADESLLVDHQQPVVVVHNPGALNPLSPNLLPAFFEYVAISGDDYYQLQRLNGSLA
jgi:type I restriction enzyme S subunit